MTVSSEGQSCLSRSAGIVAVFYKKIIKICETISYPQLNSRSMWWAFLKQKQNPSQDLYWILIIGCQIKTSLIINFQMFIWCILFLYFYSYAPLCVTVHKSSNRFVPVTWSNLKAFRGMNTFSKSLWSAYCGHTCSHKHWFLKPMLS